MEHCTLLGSGSERSSRASTLSDTHGCPNPGQAADIAKHRQSPDEAEQLDCQGASDPGYVPCDMESPPATDISTRRAGAERYYGFQGGSKVVVSGPSLAPSQGTNSFTRGFLGLDKCNACVGTSICKKLYKEQI
ncbi:deleted in autism-related protein 1, partial [Clarias magur]